MNKDKIISIKDKILSFIKKTIVVIFYIFYDLLFFSFWLSVRITALFSRNLKEVIKLRFLDKKTLIDIKDRRDKKEKSILFFCSSAGEYEQAKPLIDHYNELDYYVFIVLFSPSGIRFARARNESLDYILSPLDLKCYWSRLFKVVRPNLVYIVRHELWPNFLRVAKTHSPIVLIDAAMNRKYSKLSLFLKKYLLSYMDTIFIVDDKDFDFYRSIGEDSEIVKSNDTKYDRVRLRSEEKKDDVEGLRIRLRSLSKDGMGKDPGVYKYFIVGSAWPMDAGVVLDFYKGIKDRGENKDWKIMLAIHDISLSMVQNMEKMCKDRGLSYERYSNIVIKTDEDISRLLEGLDVIIVDVLGRLSELYGISHLCWVGGAMHYKIHNVLEPAILGLNIVHGPLYKDQKEAKLLVDSGLSTVCNNKEELYSWWLDHNQSFINQDLIDKMKVLSFGSQTILNYVKNRYLI